MNQCRIQRASVSNYSINMLPPNCGTFASSQSYHAQCRSFHIIFCPKFHLISLSILYFPLLTKVVCDGDHASVIQYTTFFNAVSLFSTSLLILKCVPTFCLTSILSCCSPQVPELEIYKRGTSQVTLVALHAGCETQNHQVKLLCLKRSTEVTQSVSYKYLKANLHYILILQHFQSM